MSDEKFIIFFRYAITDSVKSGTIGWVNKGKNFVNLVITKVVDQFI